MISGTILVAVFIIGFAFGLAMPFILEKMNIYKREAITKKEENNNPSTNMTELVDEWLNGKRGDE